MVLASLVYVALLGQWHLAPQSPHPSPGYVPVVQIEGSTNSQVRTSFRVRPTGTTTSGNTLVSVGLTPAVFIQSQDQASCNNSGAKVYRNYLTKSGSAGKPYDILARTPDGFSQAHGHVGQASYLRIDVRSFTDFYDVDLILGSVAKSTRPRSFKVTLAGLGFPGPLGIHVEPIRVQRLSTTGRTTFRVPRSIIHQFQGAPVPLIIQVNGLNRPFKTSIRL